MPPPIAEGKMASIKNCKCGSLPDLSQSWAHLRPARKLHAVYRTEQRPAMAAAHPNSLLEAVRENIRRGNRTCLMCTNITGTGEWARCIALVYIVDRVGSASNVVASVKG